MKTDLARECSSSINQSQSIHPRESQSEPLINSDSAPAPAPEAAPLGAAQQAAAKAAVPLPHEDNPLGSERLTDELVSRLEHEKLIDKETVQFYYSNKNTLEAIERVLLSWREHDRRGVRSTASPHLQTFRAPREQFPNASQTPFRLDNLMILLGDQQPEVAAYLTRSFKEGFKPEMEETRPSAVYPNPPPVSAKAAAALRKSVALDLRTGHVGCRPASMRHFVSNPIRSEPKRKNGRPEEDKFRRVHNLSKQAHGTMSVNSAISKENSTLQYDTVQDLVNDIAELYADGVEEIGINQEDVVSAYRDLPLHPSCWNQLGFSLDGVEYVELFLPFGLRSACRIYTSVSSTVRWLMRHTLQLRRLRSYVDDFAQVGPANRASLASRIMNLAFEMLGLTTSSIKRVVGASSSVFLGIGLDTKKRVLFMPKERKDNLLEDIDAWLKKDSVTLGDLQSLCGHLVHATKTVPQGQLFVRRLFAKTRWHEENTHYRSSIAISVDANLKRDLRWWQNFLPCWNGTTKMRASDEPSLAPDVVSYTDASDAAAGGTVGLEYFQVPWTGETAYMAKDKTFINERELFAATTAALSFGPRWHKKHVLFLVDNETDVWAIKNNNSKSRINLHLLRVLHFTAAICDFSFDVAHLSGVLNVVADAASRLSIAEFELRHPHLQRIAPILPPHFACEEWEASASASLLARLQRDSDWQPAGSQ